ncbi:zinc finger protein 768-like isoform X4 [Mytilus californianus]|uniref:zinc finger protein 768-like isoform X4 n=1 Tax=Mytilus californianus TaxID=6549 RepID=UPI002247FAF7|nr:zinc finger protein 768-like isoform X4 [Mytilus californianus]
MNYQKVYMNHIHSSSLLCQLAQMWRSQLLCDALICTGNVVTKAHRVVLLAACPMLQSMENASIGTELEVRLAADIKQDAVTTFLQYLYEGFMLLTEENVKHVEKVARLLQVDSVIKCCSDFFKCLEKSTGKQHNANYKFDKYDLLEFRHVRATGLQKTYHDRLMKRMSEAPRPSSPTGGKRQRLHPRPSSPPTDFMSQRADDAASMTQSYMTGNPSGAGSVRSGASSQSSRSGSPSVVEIIEDSLELIQREKSGPGQPEPSRLAQQKTSISVASHISNTKDTRVINIADDSGGGRTRVTDSFSDRVQNIPSSPQQSSQPQMPVSPKISFRDTHPPQNIQHPSPTSFIQRTPNQMSFTSQPPPPPLQQAGTLNIAPLSQTFSQDRFQQRPQEQQSSQSRPPPMSTDMFMESVKTSQSFITSTPQQRTHPSYPPISGAKPSFAIGSAAQAGAPPQSPSFQSQSTSQQQESTGMADKGEKREGESSRPPEGHDPGPEGNDDTPDLAIVKIEKVGEDETGGLLLQVDSGQGDAAHRHGQLSMEEEQEYDESDLTGDWSQEDISNEGSFQSSHMDDPTGAMYMGPTSESSHQYTRLQGKIFKCNLCDKVFQKNRLLQHISTSHPPLYYGPVRCEYCNFSCSTDDDLKHHQNEMHKYVCEICKQAFISRSGIYTHNKVYHGAADKLWKCQICGKPYGSISRLKIHEQCHTSRKIFKCSLCKKSYKYKYNLDHHKCSQVIHIENTLI